MLSNRLANSMRVASICVSGLLLAVGFVLSMGVIVVAALFMVNGIHFGVGSAWQTETEGRFFGGSVSAADDAQGGKKGWAHFK